MQDVFRIRDFSIANRLFVGTGKYQNYEVMQRALEASGCQVVTVAVRRERLVDAQGRSLLDFLDLSKYVILPNTAGCFTADDAIRMDREGSFGEGSMAPKVRAAVDFVRRTRGRTIITALNRGRDAVRGEAGTTITADTRNE